MFKKYHFFLLVSILMISVSSCRKGDQPIPVFNEVEVSADEDSAAEKTKPAEKGGDKGGGQVDEDDVVGGDDNEDDDGGGVVGSDGGDLESSDTDPKVG